MNIEEVFDGIRGRLRRDGLIVYHHHNFFCWNGHHQRPRTVDEIDASDPEQRKYLDWAHLGYRPEPDEYVARHLNRIRLDELRALTEKSFEIEIWDERLSDPGRGAGRLTAEIRAHHPEVSVRELTTQGVLCCARLRGGPPGPAAPRLADRRP